MKFIKYNIVNGVFTFATQFLNLRYQSLIMVIVMCLFSCEDFVEVELPNDRINRKVVFENSGTATAALVNIYAQMRDNPFSFAGDNNGMSNLLGHYTDELDLYSQSLPSIKKFYDNTIISIDSEVLALWQNAYSLIYASNSVIEGLENSMAISDDDKNLLKGEALFTRALLHFYLVNLYGNIPYIESSDFEVNSNAPKLPIADVYQKIIQDLLNAKTLLQDTYLTEERTRPNKGVVTALLARVYLYTENWEGAELESTSLINNSIVYTWESDVNNVFLKGSASTIWQFKPNIAGGNSGFGTTFIFETGPPPTMALTNILFNAFEPGDNRLTNWVGSATDAGMTDTWYYAFKYKENMNIGTSVEYSKLFRLAEIFLIRAEARAQLGDISGAQQDLNVIRDRAGLSNTSAATTIDLLDAILKERQVELFTEYGHRFFDLKRMGKLDAILAPIKPGWDTTDMLLPIPESEILINSNLLPQNPGY